MPKRIRRDHPNYELRHARVRVARDEYECVWCVTPLDGGGYLTEVIPIGATYARISETRLPVCSAHFTLTDIAETDKLVTTKNCASSGRRGRPRGWGCGAP